MHKPMVPGPVWVPTTGPRFTTTMGYSECTSFEHGEELVDVGGRAVADGQPAERRRGHGLFGQIAQGATPGALLRLLLDHAVDQGHDRLDGQERTEEGPGAADPPALLEVLEGVHHPEHLGAGDARRRPARPARRAWRRRPRRRRRRGR